MAKTYEVTTGTRVVNLVFRTMTRLGLGASYRWILSVRGRRTGRLRSTPVDVVEVAAARWLVAGYGPVSWVHNVRASGEVTLRRGRREEAFRAVEVGPTQALPALRSYLSRIRVIRPYFDASPGSADEALAAELPRHAVFRLEPVRARRALHRVADRSSG